MNLPPPISGLYHLIARKRGHAAWERQRAEYQRTDPREQHEATERAKSLEAEAGELEKHTRSNVAIIQAGELLIHDLASSSIQSADRTAARRDLESAVGRLRRELGDPPPAEVPSEQ